MHLSYLWSRQFPLLQLAGVFDVASHDMDLVQFGVALEESVFLQCVWCDAGAIRCEV